MASVMKLDCVVLDELSHLFTAANEAYLSVMLAAALVSVDL